MAAAMLAAKRSKDPSTTVGAVVVNPRKRIIGTGYNGFPNGCKDSCPWNREGDFLHSKYAYVVHAEINAILNSTGDTDGCTMYCTLAPCNVCAQVIIQAGISNVIYLNDKYHDKDFSVVARHLLTSARVEYRQYIGGLTDLNLSFGGIDFGCNDEC